MPSDPLAPATPLRARSRWKVGQSPAGPEAVAEGVAGDLATAAPPLEHAQASASSSAAAWRFPKSPS